MRACQTRGSAESVVPQALSAIAVQRADRFGCTHSLRVSIGVSPRSDLDYPPPGGARERFWHYVDAYPAIGEVMRCTRRCRIRTREGPPTVT